MATMMMRTDMPPAVDRLRNITSRPHRFRGGSAPPPPIGGAGRPGWPGGPPPESVSSMLGGSPATRGGSGGVGGATSVESANEGWLIRVSSPFVLALCLVAAGSLLEKVLARRAHSRKGGG